MRITLSGLSLFLFALVLPLISVAQTKSANEKRIVLDLCERNFGAPLDESLNLFNANPRYVVHVTFDKKKKLEMLEVVPRFFFEERHPEWEDSKDFEFLSLSEYKDLVGKLTTIKPWGELIHPPPAFSSVTNMTAWQTSIFQNAVVTLGVLVDISEPEGSPTRFKWFKLEFGKKTFERERKIRLNQQGLKDIEIES